MMHYNKNDVFIVCEIVRLNPEEVKSRYSVSSVYKVNVLNSSRSNMADILFEKFYSERSGLPPEKWKGKRTERTGMNLGKIIFPCVEFKTPELQKLLAEIKKTTIYRVSKEEFNKEVKIGNIVYSLGTGGLHSRDIPMEIWSTTPYDGGTIVSASPTGNRKMLILLLYFILMLPVIIQVLWQSMKLLLLICLKRFLLVLFVG